MTETLPYGTWPSPVDAEAVTAGTVRLGDLRVDGDDVYWTELRPAEDGRTVLVRWRGGSVRDVSPPGVSVRTRVHEYGGAPFAVRDGVVVFVDDADQRLHRLDPDGSVTPITPEPDAPGGLRYADADLAPDGSWLVCVQESHPPGHGSHPPSPDDVVNTVVAVPTDGSARPHVLLSGHDFYATPRLDPTGRLLAYLVWDHPDMPWDAAEARLVEVTPTSAADDRHVTGGGGIAAFQPTWEGPDSLVVASDTTGFFNLEQVRGGVVEALTDVEADIGQPHWTFGATSFALLDDGRIVAAAEDRAVSRLLVVGTDGTLREVGMPATRIGAVQPRGDGVVVLAQGPRSLGAVLEVGLDGSVRTLRAVEAPIDPSLFPEPEPVSFPTPDGGRAHAFLYRPHLPGVVGPQGERPPLVVAVHGGPTANARPVASPLTAFWTSRGFAVVDVNYRGSTGFGRDYRDALRGRWGVVDVMDTIAAATWLVDRGEVAPDRLAVRGGSAGGFTTLMALVAPDQPFSAGADLYGVADLVRLAEHTHKFESRYLDGLVGPWPQDRERYVARSPLSHVDRLRTPLLVLQGSEDAVVPPEQSELIVAAARERGVPHAYLLFDGEQHGFRRAGSIVRALTSELAFYGRVMGFTPAGDLPALDVVHADHLGP